MAKIVKAFVVEASPNRVFAVVANPENYPRWAIFVKAATSHGPKAHWVYDMGGMKVESDTEETVREVGFRQTAGFLKSGVTRLEIRPTDKGSSVVWTNEYVFPYSYLGKLMDKLRAQEQIEEEMDRSIVRLKALLER